MATEEEMIKQALEESGFPFERKVRKRLLELGLKTGTSRYFVHREDREISKEIDFLGKTISHTFEIEAFDFVIHLWLRIVGEAKKMQNSKICFYEYDNDAPPNIQAIFPNGLNHCNFLLNFTGGYFTISEIEKIFPDLPITKTICHLEEKNKPVKGGALEFDGFKNNGNMPFYSYANDLVNACEYYNKKQLLMKDKQFYLSGFFPILFVESDIFQFSGIDELSLKKEDVFLYFVACQDIDELQLTTKDRIYLPILISNFNGIEKVVKIITKLSGIIQDAIQQAVDRDPESIQFEYETYMKNRKIYQTINTEYVEKTRFE